VAIAAGVGQFGPHRGPAGPASGCASWNIRMNSSAARGSTAATIRVIGAGVSAGLA
jgi:hypothetical protein